MDEVTGLYTTTHSIPAVNIDDILAAMDKFKAEKEQIDSDFRAGLRTYVLWTGLPFETLASRMGLEPRVLFNVLTTSAPIPDYVYDLAHRFFADPSTPLPVWKKEPPCQSQSP